MGNSLWIGFGRWVWIALLTLLAAVLIHIALPLGWSYASRLSLPASINDTVLRIAAWLATVLAGYVSAWLIPIRLSHLPLAWRYPPLWFAPAAGAGLTWIGHTATSSFQFADSLGSALSLGLFTELGLALLAGCVLQKLAEATGKPPRRTSVLHSAPAVMEGPTWSVIKQWATSEEPASVDLFALRPMALRFADILQSDPAHSRSVAVTGPWGSGKTTVLRWTEMLLQQRIGPQVWCSWISCWGIDDSKVLAAYVLREVSAAVQLRMDAAELRGIPDAYLRMLGGTQLGLLSWVFQRDRDRDVLDNLETLVSLLELANAKILVVIEDADRASGLDFDLGHLERVLSRLRNTRRVSCALALDPTKARIDLLRLCEHVEPLPPLEVNHVRTVLRVTREHCLRDYQYVHLDPASLNQDRLTLTQTANGDLQEYVRRLHNKDHCDAMTTLIGTPRRLKHVVRRVVRVWDKLHGEIDLDDLIVIAVIRECCPTVFAFLLEHIDGVRVDSDHFNERPKVAQQVWKELVDRDETAAIAVPLVGLLGLKRIDENVVTTERIKQGVQQDEPTDYFRRIQAEDCTVGEVRDQFVALEVDAWLETASPTMLDHLIASTETAESYVRIWEYFADRIPNERFTDIVDELLARVVDTTAIDGHWTRHAAFAACWREHNRRGRAAFIGVERLNAMIATALPESLQLANDLYYFWTSTTHGPFTVDERVAVRRAMAERSRELFQDPRALIRAVRGDQEGSALRMLVIPADQDEPRSTESDPADWSWMARPASEALRERPELMAKQLGHLLGDTGHTVELDRRTTNYRLDWRRTEAFCGAELVGILRSVADLSATGNVIVDALREEARVRLASGDTSKPPID